MENFWFYTQMGLDHVLDLGAYDHILFLSALAIPFTFKHWKQVLVLATIFTVTHCASLFLSAFDIFTVNVSLIEFLIPVTILLTAIYNIVVLRSREPSTSLVWHMLATAFFGLVHGFGFSNYFKMLVAGLEEKVTPLLGFALGIELSQVIVVLLVLLLAYLCQQVINIKRTPFVLVASVVVIAITIPLLVATFPW
ncbi:HupE/UreJ family protein [Maribacter sp. 2307ULW6-5]|uniref:HupE/UreJ family protein n=1 Tax=Maribacter sp. 2307ULW6-5 TaxID=3386275 RepID=UPI0039BD5819